MPVHYCQLDSSTAQNAAVFGSEPKQPSARSEGGESSPPLPLLAGRPSRGVRRARRRCSARTDLPLRKHRSPPRRSSPAARASAPRARRARSAYAAAAHGRSRAGDGQGPRFERAADVASCRSTPMRPPPHGQSRAGDLQQGPRFRRRRRLVVPVHACSTGAPATISAGDLGEAQTGRGLLVPLSEAPLLDPKPTCSSGAAPSAARWQRRRPTGAAHVALRAGGDARRGLLRAAAAAGRFSAPPRRPPAAQGQERRTGPLCATRRPRARAPAALPGRGRPLAPAAHVSRGWRGPRAHAAGA